MKIFSVFVVIMFVISLFLGAGEASPVKIPINAIKKGAKAVGHGIRVLDLGSKAHNLIEQFKHRKRGKAKRKH